MEIKKEMEELDSKFINLDYLQQENLTRQIKSVWNVIGVMKKKI
jgi:hypothetical protein